MVPEPEDRLASKRLNSDSEPEIKTKKIKVRVGAAVFSVIFTIGFEIQDIFVMPGTP